MPVVYVDYPGETSLKQIYGTFNRAMLRMIPNLRTYADPLTNAMVEFYLLSQVGGNQHPTSTGTLVWIQTQYGIFETRILL